MKKSKPEKLQMHVQIVEKVSDYLIDRLIDVRSEDRLSDEARWLTLRDRKKWADHVLFQDRQDRYENKK